MLGRRTYRSATLIFGIAMFLFSSCLLVSGREPNAQAGQAVQTGARYTNSAEGLRRFLLDGVAVAKSGDKKKLSAFVQDIEIPHAMEWYIATYGQDPGEDRGQNYLDTMEEQRDDIRGTLEEIAGEGGEIVTRRVNDKPAAAPTAEREMLQGLKRPTNIYYAEWREPKTPKTAMGELIGYFVFVEGNLRVERVTYEVQASKIIHATRNPQTGRMELILPTVAKQSISGTKYMNPAGHFSLTVPAGWKTNDEIAKAPMGIGGISDPDGWANAVIQMMPTSESPVEFLQQLDARGTSQFEDYKKISDSQMTLDGEKAASIRITYTDRKVKFFGIAIPRTMEAFMVMVRVKDKDVLFNFVTTEALFSAKEATFRGIINSFQLEGQ